MEAPEGGRRKAPPPGISAGIRGRHLRPRGDQPASKAARMGRHLTLQRSA